jgi:Stress responsive A/B Barrel Domain
MHFKGVMITWKDGVGAEQQSRAEELLDSLQHTVPGIRGLYFGSRDPAFLPAKDDFGFFVAFTNREDAETFERHPRYGAANDFIASLGETCNVFRWEMQGDWKTRADSRTQRAKTPQGTDLWKDPRGTDVWRTEGAEGAEGEEGLYCHMTFVRWKQADSEAVANYESTLVAKGSALPGVVSMCAGRAAPEATQNDPYHFGIMVTYTDRKVRQGFNNHMSDTIENFLGICEHARAFDFYSRATAPQPGASTA